MSPPPTLHALITDSASIQRYPRQAPLARTTEPPPDAWRIKDFLAKFIFSIFAAFIALATPLPAFAAGSIDLSNAIGGELTEQGAIPVDFASEQQYLLDLSATLAVEPANGTYEDIWGKIRLTGDGVSDLQVFHLGGSDVLNAYTFELVDIPAEATLVLNVSGASSGLTDMYVTSLDPFSFRVLFNFYQAETLFIDGVRIEGSILAPLAHIENSGSVVAGNIVAWSPCVRIVVAHL